MGLADRTYFTVIKCPKAVTENCSRVFFRDDLCEKHCIMEHKVDLIACRVKGCGKLFNNGPSARAHEKTFRYIPDPKQSARVRCPEMNCPASVSGFTRNSDLNRHMRTIHNKKSTKKPSNVMNKDKYGRCVSKK